MVGKQLGEMAGSVWLHAPHDFGQIGLAHAAGHLNQDVVIKTVEDIGGILGAHALIDIHQVRKPLLLLLIQLAKQTVYARFELVQFGEALIEAPLGRRHQIALSFDLGRALIERLPARAKRLQHFHLRLAQSGHLRDRGRALGRPLLRRRRRCLLWRRGVLG